MAFEFDKLYKFLLACIVVSVLISFGTGFYIGKSNGLKK